METRLRKLQLTQLEMLKIVDAICNEHGIKYSLYAGTLLGAVRHKGFIPWDDDLDICMARSEYNRFIEIWMATNHSGYVLQNKENTQGFTQSFTKIRKEHTTFLECDSERGKYHTGIFIDIFPLDRVPEGRISRALYKLNCMLYQLYTREFVPSTAGIITKAVSHVCLVCIPASKRLAVRKRLLKHITRYDNDKALNTIAIETMASLKICFPSNMLDEYTTLQFEDGKFMCFADWDEHLKRKFGNYLEFPPEAEQMWKHHPIILDFEHDYEELNQR